jgi:hypothetical protein
LPPLSAPMMESTIPMDIDLLPKDWKSDRKPPREPVFGPGALPALAYWIGWFCTVAAVYYVLHR